MTETNINAHCSICGAGYHICQTCSNQKKIRPWRTVTDTIEHYKIYMAIHGYTITKNKEQAKVELQACDLSGLESFKDEIKSAIREIMEEQSKVASKRNKKSENEKILEVNVSDNE